MRLLCLAGIYLVFIQAALFAQQPDKARFWQFLQAGLHPLHSIRPEDPDTTDITVLRSMIGNHRIVMLGVEEYDCGTSMQAQARIARYLMEEMGFDVLVLEGNTFDLHKADQEMKTGRSGISAALQRSLPSAIYENAGFQGLVNYIQARSIAGNPVTVAGMDMIPYGTYATESLVQDLDAFSRKVLPVSVYSDTLLNPLDKLMFRLEKWPQEIPPGREGTLSPVLYPALLPARDSLAYQAAMQEVISRLQGLGKPYTRDAAWWLQHLRMVDACAHLPMKEENVQHLRDSLMADNLRFLLTQFPGRKMLVLCPAFSCIRDIRALEYPEFQGIIPAADQLRRQGIPVFSLVTTTIRERRNESDKDSNRSDGNRRPPYDIALVDLHQMAGSSRFFLRAVGAVPIRGEWCRATDAVLFLPEQRPGRRLWRNDQPATQFQILKQVQAMGQVADFATGKPITLASITIPGTSIGTYTDEQGRFTLEIPLSLAEDTLLISAIGYESISWNILNMIMETYLPIRLSPYQRRSFTLPVPPSGNGKADSIMAGKIMDCVTRQPVPGAVVQVVAITDSQEVIRYVTADQEGRYEISLAAGAKEIYLSCIASGYYPLELLVMDYFFGDPFDPVWLMPLSHKHVQQLHENRRYQIPVEQLLKKAAAALTENTVWPPTATDFRYTKTRTAPDGTIASEEAFLTLYDPQGNCRRGIRALEQDRQIRIHVIRRDGWEGWQGQLRQTLDALLQHDVYVNRNNLLSARRLPCFQYELEGVTNFGKDRIFIVRYTCIGPVDYATGEDSACRVSGRLYLTGRPDFAVIRHEVDVAFTQSLVRPVQADSLKPLELTRNRHLTYLYRKLDGRYQLRLVCQTDDRTWINGHQTLAEHIHVKLEARAVKTGPENAFRGRWKDLNPETAETDEFVWEIWEPVFRGDLFELDE